MPCAAPWKMAGHVICSLKKMCIVVALFTVTLE